MPTLTIGKLAKACDVKIDTIRHYERMGLIFPQERTESGYRKYSPESIKSLRFIREAQSLGFTLGEIKALLELSEEPEADCADICEYARNKITEIETRIADLLKMKDCLQELADFCPGKGRPLRDCNIINHFYGDDE